MIHFGVVWLSLLATGAPQSEMWAPATQLPSNEAEQMLLDDATDGKLDNHSLLKSALIAAGCDDPKELTLLQFQFDQLALRMDWDEFSDKSDDSEACTTQVSMAKHLLAEMHRIFLTGDYEASCSDLRDTIRSGRYNCVTATIVYQILARQRLIDSRAVAVPAHVFCELDNPNVDIQTTCATWLKPGIGRDSVMETQSRRPLSDTELIAKVYYNRGVLHLHKGNFAEAVRVLRLSLLLDHDDRIANSNLLAAINNWSLAEASQGRFSSASELLSIGRSLDGSYAPIAANDLHIHQRWVQSLCRDGRFEFALAVMNEGLRRRPDAKLFEDGRYVVLRLWAIDIWGVGRIDEGFALFDEDDERFTALVGPDSPSWNVDRLHQTQIVAITAAAAKLASNGRRATAVRLLNIARRRFGDERIENLLEHLTSSDS